MLTAEQCLFGQLDRHLHEGEVCLGVIGVASGHAVGFGKSVKFLYQDGIGLMDRGEYFDRVGFEVVDGWRSGVGVCWWHGL